jgi:hypothetical protein
LLLAGCQQGEQGVSNGASRASPAKQGEHQEYIYVLFFHRQSLQNKTVASIHSMHTCLLRATFPTSDDLAQVHALKVCGLAYTNKDVAARVNAFGPLAFCQFHLPVGARTMETLSISADLYAWFVKWSISQRR